MRTIRLLHLKGRVAKNLKSTNYETGRFTVTETSDAFTEGYAVWDGETQDYYVAGDGTVPTFTTQGEADTFCNKLK